MDRRNFIIKGGQAMLGSILMNSFFAANTAGVSANRDERNTDRLTLFLAGDVMTGRGIDQVLPSSVDPRIYETYSKSAERYVQLAEQESGPIPENVSNQYIWGDALEVFERIDPDARIINLETSVTTSDNYWEGKGIHYRMHPENTDILRSAGIDICVLGNNHMLDWGYDGLRETLDTLKEEGVQTAGAGRSPEEAAAPAVEQTASGRLLVFSYGSTPAGVPMVWGVDEEHPGVNILPHINADSAEAVISDIRRYRKEGDRVVVSVHWGSNWGYDIPDLQQSFAHRLIDSGLVDVIHGHSSHHPKGIEVYQDRPIFYGCGDLINDYEGIGGREKYRGDLSLLYFPELNSQGELISLTMEPMQIYRFQLRNASKDDRAWLVDTLDRECQQFGHSVEQGPEGALVLRWT